MAWPPGYPSPPSRPNTQWRCASAHPGSLLDRWNRKSDSPTSLRKVWPFVALVAAGSASAGSAAISQDWQVRQQPQELLQARQRLVMEKARGAMIIGSVGRGTALEASDLDVLVVAADDDAASFRRELYGHRLVETVSKSLAGWRTLLTNRRPRWVWALTEGGEVLFDDGALHGLIEEAAALLTHFVSSEEVKAELATNLWHSRAKLERAVSSADPHIAAYAAGLAAPDVLDALFALHNRPCVPGSHRMNVLATLNLADADRLLLDELLIGDPLVRARAAIALNWSLSARLGPPDLERTAW